jgi:hypothetical protein
MLRFLKLLQSGTGIEKAGREAGLSEETVRILAHPDNGDAVRAFMQCPERISELCARL